MKRVAFVKSDSSGREHFAAATDLPTFLAQAGELTCAQRQRIVEQALILVGENYAHLPLKRAMHSIDPVQRLRLLLQTLKAAAEPDQPTEIEFHREMTDIFMSLRDLHTNYLLPAPYNQMTAFLPFLVEDYVHADGQRGYVVSHVVTWFTHPTFVPGVEVLHWNGMPIERAVSQNGQRYAGSNREARHARGVETLTIRALLLAPPPDEDWVIVGYETGTGERLEIRMNWQVTPSIASRVDPDSAGRGASVALGIDLENEIIRRMRAALFAPEVLAASRETAAPLAARDSRYPDIFTAKEVVTPSGTFGYLRIRTFNHWPPEQFVGEFLRLIALLPQRGLIIDVRGNGGGVIMNGELILQTLTPRTIEPEPVQFINTPRNLEICRRNGPQSQWTDLSAWRDSIAQALQTGAVFSAGFPISDPEECNAIGQRYFGPVVLITDALCYSTTDIFAAGFQDHGIGTVLGTDGNTGAGGANVWEHQSFVSDILPDSGYEELPNGAGMRISIRRTLRVGGHAGAPVEDLGVIPQERHFLTRNDVLHDNEDLIRNAASLLAARPVRALKVKFERISSTHAKVIAETEGMTRLDVYLDDRPNQSIEVENGLVQFDAPLARTLELRGFDGGQLAARYRTEIHA
ncbi:MAG TPA: S41 family peptidase [Thermoanaerobaculia bacterium]|jgi:C-terminal processing protease CtpA/Prc|nr:S41 family peptidase [Thermoanaerobaculia bacterium]